ncbi:hypothetical protein KC959_01095 [Candidatus Saccharibacteria bacterium]|nr:hypothetical protein [Candidatus Saccharibacteria bacterium]
MTATTFESVDQAMALIRDEGFAIAERTRSFVDGAHTHLGDYVTGLEKVDIFAGLSVVVMRGFFSPRLVEGLVDAAETVGYSSTKGITHNTPFYADTGIAVVNAFRKAVDHGTPRINSVYVNKYIATDDEQGGVVHCDEGSAGPVVIIAHGDGVTRVGKTPIGGRPPRVTKEALRDFEQNSRGWVDVRFGGGDVLVFDGRSRLHQGRASGPGKVRTSFVGYSLAASSIVSL